MNRDDTVVEIDLWKLLSACLQKWWIILLATLIGGIGSFVVARTLIIPTYESTVKIYVNNSEINVGNLSISASDLSASMQLVDVYEVILNTKDTMDIVIQRADLPYDHEELMKMLETTAVNDTQVFQVTVTSISPQEAQLIAATIGEVLPDVIAGIIDSADARIVEHAIVPNRRSAPSYSICTVVGAFIGCVIAAMAVCISEMTDTTIKSEEDLLEVTDLPILTHIPDFEGEEKAKYGYGKKAYAYGGYYGSNGKRGDN